MNLIKEPQNSWGKNQIDKHTIIVGDYNIFLSVIDKVSRLKKNQ